VPAFLLACLAYVSVALPGSTLGLLWPSVRHDLHQPVGALGGLLIFGVSASILASAATGRLLSRLRAGAVLALGTAATALALGIEALTGSLFVFGCGMVCFGLGFGALDAALNAYAAHHFDARRITWLHASYGVGATAGPVLATAMLGSGYGWRMVYGTMAVVQALVALALLVTGRAWAALPPPPPRQPAEQTRTGRRAVIGSLVFTAVESGIESAAGIWGYVYLTGARGLTGTAAGAAVSGYWAMMFAGRVVLGALAQRLGASRVLGAAVAGVSAGAALMAVPGPSWLAVAGLMVVGLAAAPVFPLFTLTTAERFGARTTSAVGLQVAASAVGGAAIPAGIGLAPGGLALPLLGLSLAMGGVYAGLRPSRSAVARPRP
jgi:fucose permease